MTVRTTSCQTTVPGTFVFSTITGCAFVVELGFLEGRQKLAKYDVLSLVNYADET